MLAIVLFILVTAAVPGQTNALVRQSEEHFARGVQLQQRGDLQGARQSYEAALKLVPRRVDALSNLGVVHARLGQYEQAIKHYTQALAVDASQPAIRLNLGIAFFQIQQFDQARRELARVVTAEPTNNQARLLHGLCLFQSGKSGEAVTELEAVYRAEPENVSVAYALASAYIDDKQLDKGEALIDRVFRSLGSAEAHLIMGAFNAANKNHKQAIEELTQAKQLNPKIPTVSSQLGTAYLWMGDRDRAMKEFQEELAVNPRDYVANLRLGWLYREDGRLDEAAVLLKRTLDLRPNEVGALFQLAQVFLAKGETQEAVSLLERVVKEASDYSAAHVLLARLYYKLKRPQDAERERAIIERLNAEQQKKQPTAEQQKAKAQSVEPD